MGRAGRQHGVVIVGRFELLQGGTIEAKSDIYMLRCPGNTVVEA
jgi:hypothetical protein